MDFCKCRVLSLHCLFTITNNCSITIFNKWIYSICFCVKSISISSSCWNFNINDWNYTIKIASRCLPRASCFINFTILCCHIYRRHCPNIRFRIRVICFSPRPVESNISIIKTTTSSITSTVMPINSCIFRKTNWRVKNIHCISSFFTTSNCSILYFHCFITIWCNKNMEIIQIFVHNSRIFFIKLFKEQITWIFYNTIITFSIVIKIIIFISHSRSFCNICIRICYTKIISSIFYFYFICIKVVLYYFYFNIIRTTIFAKLIYNFAKAFA